MRFTRASSANESMDSDAAVMDSSRDLEQQLGQINALASNGTQIGAIIEGTDPFGIAYLSTHLNVRWLAIRVDDPTDGRRCAKVASGTEGTFRVHDEIFYGRG